MSADSFHVFYGLRLSLGPEQDLADAQLEPLELGTEARLVRSAELGLDTWWGRDFGGGEYFLLVGRALGRLGVEGDLYVTVSDAQLDDLRAEVASRLAAGGFPGRPALHLQAEIDA